MKKKFSHPFLKLYFQVKEDVGVMIQVIGIGLKKGMRIASVSNSFFHFFALNLSLVYYDLSSIACVSFLRISNFIN